MVTATEALMEQKLDWLGLYKVKEGHDVPNGNYPIWEKAFETVASKFLYRSLLTNKWMVGDTELSEEGVEVSSSYSAFWPDASKLLWEVTGVDTNNNSYIDKTIKVYQQTGMPT